MCFNSRQTNASIQIYNPYRESFYKDRNENTMLKISCVATDTPVKFKTGMCQKDNTTTNEQTTADGHQLVCHKTRNS